MARAPRQKPASDPKPQTTAVTNWEEELARDAEAAAGQEASAGGAPAFSTKGGILAFNDAPLPGNQVAAIILDSVMENTFYEEAYDPDNITPPTCYALGRDAGTLSAHADVVARGQDQSDGATCSTCPMNQFGTANVGRGKACGNRRRLMLIPAGTFDKNDQFIPFENESDYETAMGGMLKVPPTSIRGWANFVKQLSGGMNLPPHGVYTRVQVVPDAKSQFKVTFSPIDRIPGEFMGVVMRRRKEIQPLIEQPYNLDVEDAPKPEKKKPVNKRPEVKRGAGTKTKY